MHIACRDSKLFLESVLQQWASWHATTFAKEVGTDAQEATLASGSVVYDPGSLLAEGLQVWEDRPGKPGSASLETSAAFNIHYEKVGTHIVFLCASLLTCLDESMQSLACSPACTTFSMQTILSNISPHRHQIPSFDYVYVQSCVQSDKGCSMQVQSVPMYDRSLDSPLVTAEPNTSDPTTRRQVTVRRCFNCGSYGHGLQVLYCTIGSLSYRSVHGRAKWLLTGHHWLAHH